jgi:hypothetical protein
MGVAQLAKRLLEPLRRSTQRVPPSRVPAAGGWAGGVENAVSLEVNLYSSAVAFRIEPPGHRHRNWTIAVAPDKYEFISIVGLRITSGALLNRGEETRLVPRHVLLYNNFLFCLLAYTNQ